MRSIRSNLHTGLFLAIRELRRSSKWTTILIIFIMSLTFLNLVVVRGILVGLIAGSKIAAAQYYSSDLLISTPTDKDRIENSSRIYNILSGVPNIQATSSRYTAPGILEANYKTKIRENDKTESVGTIVTGIDPENEDQVTNLSQALVDGAFLQADDIDQVILGTNLLGQYNPAQSAGQTTLQNVQVGSKIRLTVNNITREFTLKGVIKTKVNQVDLRAYIPEKQFHPMLGRDDHNVNEIAIKLTPDTSAMTTKDTLIANNVNRTAKIQTAEESLPQFVIDIEQTFNILGTVIGSIGLVVATISIFIVIFVNAITRRKYIGILKGIGVTPIAIELSYMFQSFFYALIGIAISIVITFSFIKPYFADNPIDFPFSDGILVAELPDVLNRGLLLLATTIFAGYVPARIVVKQNTLDAILGR